MDSNSLRDPYAALKIPEFGLFIAGRFCSTLALQAQMVAVGWQIYDLTRDPLALGLTGLAEAVPSILVALYAGYLADVASRKKIIAVCYAALAFCAAALLVYSFDPQNSIESFGVLPVYAVIFVTGIARGFIAPAVFSLMPQTLPGEEFYHNAVGWNITAWQAGSVAGPAIGGLICGFYGVSAAFAASLFLMILAFLFFARIRPRPQQSPKITEASSVKEKLLTGIRFVFANQIILAAMCLDLFAVLFGGAVALLPVFAADILRTGAQGLGFLRAAPAVGSILAGFYLTHRPIKKNAGKKMLAAVAGFGACMILFGLSTNFYFSLVLLLLSGAFDSVSVFVRHTLVQLLTPDSLKGRVSSVNSIFINSSNEIGAFESGLAARAVGTAASVVFGGAMTLLVVVFIGAKAKKLRKLQL